MSFAIAFVIWVFAKASQLEQSTLDVPVLAEISDRRVETRIEPERIPVEVRYPRELQPYINSQNLHFRVSTSDLREDLSIDWKTKTQVLSEREWIANVPQASRIQIVKIGTQNHAVEVRMRWKAEPAMVKPDLVGMDSIAEGFQLVTPVRVNPRDVWIVGNSEVLSSLARDEATSRIQIMTDRIDVSSIEKSTWKSAPLKLPPGVEVVEPEGEQVEVNLEVQEIQTVRQIGGVKINLQAVSPESVELDYKEKNAEVTVHGPQSLLKQLTAESLEVKMIRAAEEIPGTSRDVLLQAQFSSSVPAETRSKLTIKAISPEKIRIRYLPKGLPMPAVSQ